MLTPTSFTTIHRITLVALMAALIAAGAFIFIPIGPVPITFQDFFICLAGLIMGPRQSLWVILLYLSAGIAGFPVFSGGRGGLGHLLGPTCGYIVGFIPFIMCSGIGGWLVQVFAKAESAKQQDSLEYMAKILILTVIPSLGGVCLLYFCGAAGLMLRLDISYSTAIAVGVAPFLPFMLPKILLACFCFYFLRKRYVVSL